MSKIAFVTGGTGFVGSHLVDELLQRGYAEVRCLVRNDPKWLAGKEIVTVSGDLGHENILRKALKDVTHVYHVAAVTRARDEEEFIRSNVEATVRLLRAARAESARIERVLVTSSLAVVGDSGVAVADEQTALNPVSMYGRSKVLMESRTWDTDADGRSFKDVLPITVVRPPSVYGPRERDIFTFFKALNLGVCPIVGGEGSGPISLVHVQDLVRGMADAAESEAAVGETYFLGSEDSYSWEQIRDASTLGLGRKVITLPVPAGLVEIVGASLEAVSGLFNVYPPLNREKAREITKACKACSSDKAAGAFGYRANLSLEEGISTTIEWYRQEGWLS